jgi:hypothetical protein
MIGLLRQLAAMLAVIALLAAPLSEVGVNVSSAMGHSMSAAQSLSAASEMTCKACGQSAARSTVCSANPCALFGILAETAIAAEKGQSAFFIVQSVAPEERALTPPTPPA